MTGRRYYITSLGAWQRHAARFAYSHWLALDARDVSREPPEQASSETLRATSGELPDATGMKLAGATSADLSIPTSGELSVAARILVLVEADEGVHLSLDDDEAFEALPHPLAPKSISERAQTALAAYGVTPNATMFETTEIIARSHPLLRHRVF